jgi:uncharacterized protein (DUF2147 family)
MMKRLLAIAAFLLASSAAQAQYSFEYGGRTIRIDPDRGTVSIPGVYDNTVRKARRPHSNQESAHSKPSPQEAKSDPQAAPSAAAADTAAAPTTATPAPANGAASPEPSTATANNTPADNAVSPPPAPPAPAPLVLKESVPAPRPEASRPEASRPDPSPTLAAVPPSTPAPAVPAQRPQGPAPAAAAVRDANSPLGVWLTEEKEGKVRIEQCGVNLCGYSVDTKSNLNGEQVLINMRPNKDAKWSGRILDPNTGSTYDSTIALKGDVLRVQGCAFGGMFCGGQTWTRVN